MDLQRPGLLTGREYNNLNVKDREMEKKGDGDGALLREAKVDEEIKEDK